MKKNNLKILKPIHFSFQEVLHFLDRGYDDCLYRLGKDSVSRLIHFSDGLGLITIVEGGDCLVVELDKESVSESDLDLAKKYVLEWFDMKRDISPFYHLLSKQKEVADLPKRFDGCRLVGIPNLYEALCWAIIGQQINLTFAYKLKRVLVEEYGVKKEINGEIYYAFPSPEVLRKVDRDRLKELKFSRQKIDYILNVSEAFVLNTLSKRILNTHSTYEDRVEELVSIKGIGIWTANYVLMKTMHEMECITYGDSGLNKALHLVFGTEKKPTKKTVDEIFSHFSGWESYFNFYLWRSLSTQ